MLTAAQLISARGRVKPSLFAHVLDRLGAEIVRGGFAAGTLPREQELCDQLGASRSVVREVLRVLSEKGLVISRPKVGVRLRPSTDWNLLDIDVLDWIWRSGAHDRFVRDFLEFRLTFEPMSCFQAASRASTEARAEIMGNYERLIAAVDAFERGGDREYAISCDLDFHRSIYLASGNSLSAYLAEMVAHLLRLQVDATTSEPGEFSRGLSLHKGVAESISSGDAPAAYGYSLQLVRMPYEAFMTRHFPREVKLEPPAPFAESRAAIAPARARRRK